MGYTIQDILLSLKVRVMQTGYQMLKTRNPIVLCIYTRERSNLMEILKTSGYCQIHNGVSVYSIGQMWGRDGMVTLLFIRHSETTKACASNLYTLR